jgi:2-polyprenyl-6-methoxyphenol hydroxylase-like FAD-dependent oxidoreductase
VDASVVVIGAGPVGLTLAGRLAQHGVQVALYDAAPAHLAAGSRALCMQRETLEIWDRLGIGQQVADRGVQWRIGRTYFRGRELFSVTLPGTTDDHFPPFVNISQTEVEELLIARLAELGVVPHWGHELTGLAQDAEHVTLTFANGVTATAAYAVGTDGAHSAVRHAIGVGFAGHTFDDRFLITDVHARLPFPAERRFFFDPPWNPGRQVLIHPQPDDVWRIDWQVPAETDAEMERDTGALQKAYELNEDCRMDIPSVDPPTRHTFDEFRREDIDAPSALLDAFYLAIDKDGGYLGVSNMFRSLDDPTFLWQGITGVRREARGKGIAMALKLRTVRYAIDHGIGHIKTWNDVHNKAMLSINEAMGFAKEPAWVSYEKDL